jgi:hypothetical protein
MESHFVTHNGKQYAVTRLANGYQWRLESVDNPNNRITLNRQQMLIFGFFRQMGENND